jgi:hypothetical protein
MRIENNESTANIAGEGAARIVVQRWCEVVAELNAGDGCPHPWGDPPAASHNANKALSNSGNPEFGYVTPLYGVCV